MQQWRLRHVADSLRTWRSHVEKRASLLRIAPLFASHHASAFAEIIMASWRHHVSSMQRMRCNVLATFRAKRMERAFAALLTGCNVSRKQRFSCAMLLSRVVRRKKAAAVIRGFLTSAWLRQHVLRWRFASECGCRTRNWLHSAYGHDIVHWSYMHSSSFDQQL